MKGANRFFPVDFRDPLPLNLCRKRQHHENFHGNENFNTKQTLNYQIFNKKAKISTQQRRGEKEKQRENGKAGIEIKPTLLKTKIQESKRLPRSRKPRIERIQNSASVEQCKSLYIERGREREWKIIYCNAVEAFPIPTLLCQRDIERERRERERETKKKIEENQLIKTSDPPRFCMQRPSPYLPNRPPQSSWILFFFYFFCFLIFVFLELFD